MTYLWCHKLRGTAERARARPVPHVFLAQTIIGNLDVAVECEENVVELQVTIDDTVLMEVLERQTDLGSVEPMMCQQG
jgi:hypothetical protein